LFLFQRKKGKGRGNSFDGGGEGVRHARFFGATREGEAGLLP